MGGLGCLAQGLGFVADHSGFTDTPVFLGVSPGVGDCLPHILGQRKPPAIDCSRIRNRNDDGLGSGLNFRNSLVNSLAAGRINLGIPLTAALDDARNDMIRSCFGPTLGAICPVRRVLRRSGAGGLSCHI